jgi:hypothetical protein
MRSSGPGVLTLMLAHSAPWPEAEPTSEVIPRIARCLDAIKSGEAKQSLPPMPRASASRSSITMIRLTR